MGSFLAIFPLGVWTFFHLWHNLAAFRGAKAWQTAVTEYPNPIAEVLGFVVVLAPLALHTFWGIQRLFSVRPNNLRYPFYANLKFLVHRLASVGILFFLGAHLWLAAIHPRLFEGHPEAFADISHEMRFHLPTLLVYLLGTLGVCFHLGNGLQTFAMGWGITASQKSMDRLEWVSIGTFLLLLTMSWAAIYALWSAGT